MTNFSFDIRVIKLQVTISLPVAISLLVYCYVVLQLLGRLAGSWITSCDSLTRQQGQCGWHAGRCQPQARLQRCAAPSVLGSQVLPQDAGRGCILVPATWAPSQIGHQRYGMHGSTALEERQLAVWAGDRFLGAHVLVLGPEWWTLPPRLVPSAPGTRRGLWHFLRIRCSQSLHWLLPAARVQGRVQLGRWRGCWQQPHNEQVGVSEQSVISRETHGLPYGIQTWREAWPESGSMVKFIVLRC